MEALTWAWGVMWSRSGAAHGSEVVARTTGKHTPEYIYLGLVSHDCASQFNYVRITAGKYVLFEGTQPLTEDDCVGGA